MDEMMQYIADQLKMNTAIVGLFKEGITVEQLKHYIANAPIENLYKYAQKIPEGMVTGTGAEPPKQGCIVKVVEDGPGLTDEELRANPTLIENQKIYEQYVQHGWITISDARKIDLR